MLFDEGRATPSCLSRSNRLRKYSSSMAGAAVETANSWPMTSRRRTAAASVVLRWWAVPVLLVVLFMFTADLDIFCCVWLVVVWLADSVTISDNLNSHWYVLLLGCRLGCKFDLPKRSRSSKQNSRIKKDGVVQSGNGRKRKGDNRTTGEENSGSVENAECSNKWEIES